MNDSGKRLKVFAPLFFSLVLILGIFLGFKLRDEEGYQTAYFSSDKDNLLHQIFKLIDLKYVDSIKTNQLKSNAINGILHHLDPHSVYIPPRELTGVKEEMQGSFHGIGIAYFIIEDTINVTRVLPGGPAEKAGIAIGDQIIRAGDSLVAGVHITPERIKNLLRGPVRSKVHLTVLRADSLLKLEFKRGIIPLKSIDAAYMIRPGIAYVRINRFSAHTYSEFMDAIVKLKQQQPIKKFILDLRNNPGGYLESAVNIADEFLSGHKIVVTANGRNYPKKEFTCGKAGEFEDIPLAILVNGYSASASEILAGAIQDWDRGYIIGRQTYGKGLVQEQYRLTNGAALRLTVARYYLPSGRLIQRPYKHRMSAYEHDLFERFEHGELLHKDSIQFNDTTVYYTKKEHRKVHAGDGIMPDAFVPIDTTRLSGDLIALYNQHLLFRFAYQYHNQHPELFSGIKSATELQKTRVLPDTILKAIKKFAPESTKNIDHINNSEKKLVKLQIKAFIAREIWQENGYYMLINQEDKGIEKALEVLKKEPDLKTISKTAP